MIKFAIMDGITAIVSAGIAAGVATKLIDKIADATGVLYEPRKIKKLAKAEADAAIDRAKTETHLIVERAKATAIAEIIRTENQIEISELQKRTAQRLLQEEVKKQENLEDIMEKTIPLLKEGSKPEEMNDDWLMNYVDKAKLVSDEEMKTLWAKILAGEANEPNSFSKRTVNFLASMDKKDAEMFTKLCCLTVNFDELRCPCVYNYQDSFFEILKLDFYTLSHLDSIGLIKFNNLSGFTVMANAVGYIKCFYFDKITQIRVKTNETVDVGVGTVIFTPLGSELLRLCETQPIDGFFEYIVGKISEQENLEIVANQQDNKVESSVGNSSLSTVDTDFLKVYNGVIDGGEF
jgi:hypothetical protein